jgi:cell fate regulator YaaT (PSP1 superfamily)
MIQDNTAMQSQDELVEVRFKCQRRAVFRNTSDLPLRLGDFVVVKVDRGEDLGVIARKGAHIDTEGAETEDLLPVLRLAGEDDLKNFNELKAKEKEAYDICLDKIQYRRLRMKLVDVEYQFDKNKIIFYFTAEKRVDFRELVKDLAAVFRTRIEMCQIGVREEAQRFGGYGSCGRPLCCMKFLMNFEPVTLKMAKEQYLAPNPSKISGLCGRLMCCLAYEKEFYDEIARRFPQVGQQVATASGEGVVTRIDPFNEYIWVSDEEGIERKYSMEEFQEKITMK